MTPDELAKQIPDEVVEAAAREIAMAHGVSETAWKAWTLDGRAVAAAVITAWPGVMHDCDSRSGTDKITIILPIKETPNAE